MALGRAERCHKPVIGVVTSGPGVALKGRRGARRKVGRRLKVISMCRYRRRKKKEKRERKKEKEGEGEEGRRKGEEASARKEIFE